MDAKELMAKITSVQVFGELIRNLAFTKEGVGCYETFELEPDFVKTKTGKLLPLIKDYAGEDFLKETEMELREYTNGFLSLAWFWDGDGYLIVSDGERIAVNSDCKNDWNWKWYDEKTNCSHNNMVANDNPDFVWKCDDCGYVYGKEM